MNYNEFYTVKKNFEKDFAAKIFFEFFDNIMRNIAYSLIIF